MRYRARIVVDPPCLVTKKPYLVQFYDDEQGQVDESMTARFDAEWPAKLYIAARAGVGTPYHVVQEEY